MLIRNKMKLLFHGFAGFGLNLLNLIIGSYLCSALLVGGFHETDIANQTYIQQNLVIAAAWSVFVILAKLIDGVIDIPFASWSDKIYRKTGKRQHFIIGGSICTILFFLLFLVVPNPSGISWLNTIYYGIILIMFYSAYTLTMVTYYATFSEITQNDTERQFLSNVKSVFDILYFIIGFVGVSLWLNVANIRTIALSLSPCVLTMIIPIFTLKKQKPVRINDTLSPNQRKTKGGFLEVMRNKSFISWMSIFAILTMSVQLFLGGINEYFSATQLSMPLVAGAALLPVPFTLMLYNKINKHKGFIFSFRYVVTILCLSTLSLFAVSWMPAGIYKTILAVCCGLCLSFAIGPFFALSYSIPSTIAVTNHTKNPAMYFAIQGVFCGIATGIATGGILVLLKSITGLMKYLSLFSSSLALITLFLSLFLMPKEFKYLYSQEDKKK